MKKLLSALTILAIANFFFTAPFAFALSAPAFDAITFGYQNSGLNTLTISHIVAGAGECDVAFITTLTGSDILSTITDNGTNMTLESKHQTGTADHFSYIYFLAAPVGTTNIIITTSSNIGINGQIVSYSGCGGVDTVKTTLGPATGSVSTTTVTNFPNDTLVSNVYNFNNPVTDTWGATDRGTDTSCCNMLTSDKTISTAQTVTVSYTASTVAAWSVGMIALCPTGGCSATKPFDFGWWFGF